MGFGKTLINGYRFYNRRSSTVSSLLGPSSGGCIDGGNSVRDRAQVKQGDQGSARLLRGPPSVYWTYIHVTYVTNIYVCCMSKAVYQKVSSLYLEEAMALKPLL